MATVFDSEQWDWRRAYKHKLFSGNMDNTVYVCPQGWKKSQKVYVEIPSDFFTLFVTTHKNEPLDEVDLYAEFDAHTGHMVFGYQLADGRCVNLWSYYKLPAWLDHEVESDPD